jgi:hypothetical protein
MMHPIRLIVGVFLIAALPITLTARNVGRAFVTASRRRFDVTDEELPSNVIDGRSVP